MNWKTEPRAVKTAALREAARLLKNKRGNALAITAAAIFPMLAVIGGGVDVARAYLVKSRINEACDAASLAGRRAMTNEDINTAASEANKFFNQNFKQGYLGSAGFTPAITRPDTGIVKIDAQTTVPTTLMRLFGYTSIPVQVTCNASQNFDNIDIVLVVDLSSTMNTTINGKKKIDALKEAVMALYKELEPAQEQLKAQGLRLRYGVVPYNATVNVGKLIRDVNPSYIADNWTYHSRTKSGSSYTYGPKTVDVSLFKLGNPVNIKTIFGDTGTSNKTWTGCIEERQTVSSITSTSSTAYGDLPSGAYDLNVDMVPTSDATKWKPQFPDIVYYPSDNPEGSKGQKADDSCPSPAKLLTETSESDLQSYVNSLTIGTGTLTDIGMIWGARLISRGGIFAANNPSDYNNRPVARFIVFMTDGDSNVEPELSGAYGVERLARQITGGTYDTDVPKNSSSEFQKRQLVRFEIACSAAKQGGASVWTIMFSTPSGYSQSDIDRLKRCASNSDQVAASANGDALIAKFKEIAKNIGTLRLSK